MSNLEKAYWFEVYGRRPWSEEEGPETPEVDAYLGGLADAVQEAVYNYGKDHPAPKGMSVDIDRQFSTDVYELDE